MKVLSNILIIAALAVFLGACSSNETGTAASNTNSPKQGKTDKANSKTAPDTIIVYLAKSVVTPKGAIGNTNAIAVAKGRVVTVGLLSEVLNELEGKPFLLDGTFEDKVVTPGFGKQHLNPALALALRVRVIAPEQWELPQGLTPAANSREEYLELLKKTEKDLPNDKETLFTWGYHEDHHGKVTRLDLDAINPERAIVVLHRSDHEMILSTAALDQFDLTEDTIRGHGEASKQVDWQAGRFYEQGLDLVFDRVHPVLARNTGQDTITAGSTANFTILTTGDPEVDPTRLAKERVWGTMYEGRLFPAPNVKDVASGKEKKESKKN